MPANGETLRFGVPRKGAWEDQALVFLEDCGMRVRRGSERQLIATVAGMPGVTVLLQRAEDVLRQVIDGKIDIGMTGLDQLYELRGEGDEYVMLHDELGFSSGDVVIAVPTSWVDVSTIADLSEVALSMRERGEQLRVATSFPNLVKRFFYDSGITHFTFVELKGGVEAAPGVGFADIVADINVTGTTMRENHLKVLRNALVMRFQACLIGNRRSLADSQPKREQVRRILELVEARLRAQRFYSITANLEAAAEDEVAAALVKSPATRGRRGPTIARVYSNEPSASAEAWFAATVIVEGGELQDAIDHLRSVGGSGISVLPVRYLFDERSDRYDAMLAALGVS